MEPKQADNPIYHSYIKRSSRIINFSKESEMGELYSFEKARDILSSFNFFWFNDILHFCYETIFLIKL